MSCKGCKGKDHKCNDCKDFIYRRIEQPDCYDFSIDVNPFEQYYYPINDYEGNLPKDVYDDWDEFLADYTQYLIDNVISYTTPLPYGGARAFFETVDEALAYYATLPTQSYASFFRIHKRNRKYKTYLDNHPSVLTVSPGYYKNALSKPYSSLETPTWLLKFPLCGVSGTKDMGWGTFKVNKKCKNYKIEYRLRLRPITFINRVEDGDPCDPFSLDSFFIEDDYDSYQSYVDMIKAMQTNEGHKWLGFTPLRLESGIYSHLKNKYEPVVWSDWGYPQNTLAWGHRYWYKKHPDKITCIPCDEILFTRASFADLRHLEMSPNVTTSNIVTSRSILSDDEVLYYNYKNPLSSGFFRASTDNINDPSYLHFSNLSQNDGGITDSSKINSNRVSEKLQKYMSGFISPSGPSDYAILDLTLQYQIGGEWIDVLNIDYNVNGIVNSTTTSMRFEVLSSNINSYDATYVTLSGGLSGPNEFIKTSTYQHRYVLDVIFHRTTSTTLPFSTANVSLPNYSRLMDDFVFEIEGFVDVDMNEETDISIYLKALPDNHQGVDIGLKNKNNYYYGYGPSIYGNPLDKYNMDTANCSANVIVDECYPWGPLSVDGRTGWKGQDEVHYEPLLPIKYTHINDNNITDDYNEMAASVYRWDMKYTPFAPEFAIMIEDGWIRITPDCDDCCD